MRAACIKSELRLGLGALVAAYLLFMLMPPQPSELHLQLLLVFYPFAFIAVISGILSAIVKHLLNRRADSSACRPAT